MKNTAPILAITASLFASPLVLADQCPEGVNNCNMSEQTMGDTASSADNAQTESSNSGTSSADNNASYTGGTAGDLQQSDNLVDQHGAKQSAKGGSSTATGNRSDNRSSASNGGNTTGDMRGEVSGSQSMDANDMSNHGRNEQGQGQEVSHSGNSASGVAGSGNSSQGQDAHNAQGQSVAHSGNASQSGTNAQGQKGTNKQGQDAHNEQGIAKSGNSKQGQSVSGSGNSHNRTGSTSRGASSNTRMDASSHDSYSQKIDARSLYVERATAPVIPNQNPAAGVGVTKGTCGPLQSVNRQEFKAHYMGMIWNSSLANGTEDFLQPFVDRNGYVIQYKAYETPEGGWAIYGNRPIFFYSAINTSGSRQIGGGGGTGFTRGQASAGSSSAIQRVVINIRMDECLLDVQDPPPAPVLTKPNNR